MLRNSQKSWLHRTATAAIALAAAGVLLGTTAEQALARSECRHACNEVRHQCKRVAKALRKAERKTCDVERAACRGECATDSNPRDCQRDCKDRRHKCRHDSNDLEKLTKKACKDSRDSCRDTCETAANPACFETCGQPMDDCLQANKDAADACDAACPNDETRRECRAQCAADRMTGDSICTDTFTACMAGCAVP